MTLYTLAPGLVRDLDLPPAVPPTSLIGVDLEEGPRAVVTLHVAMTRNMLAAALETSANGSYDGLDAAPVERIRELVEGGLCVRSPYELVTDGAAYECLQYEPETARNVTAVYRAVDRAYPLYAPKES